MNIQKYNIGAHGLPVMQLPDKVVRLTHGRHCQKEADVDRYGAAHIPTGANLYQSRSYIVEVEADEDTKTITKIVMRSSNKNKDGTPSTTHDRTIVIMIPELFIKTCWLNEKTDTHRTLKQSDFTKVPTASVYRVPV